MRIVLTGGGTGGHIYPALAIARGLKENNPKAEVLFLGTAKGLEADIVPREGFNFEIITAEALRRKLSLRVFKTVFSAIKGFFDALRILKRFKPTVVVGTGGYVCAPVISAAVMLKIPTLIHEQNAYPGITNKLLSGFVTKVAATFPESRKYFSSRADIKVTGLPVRPEITMAEREAGVKALSLDGNRFTVLVLGGSRGARSINKALPDVAAKVCGQQGMQLVLVTGQTGYEETLGDFRSRGIDLAGCGNVTVTPYLYNIDEALAVADLVICRAGATSIAEITVRGLPSVLIPYPYASGNHQEYNAEALVRKGAAVMIPDRNLTSKVLWDTIYNLFSDRQVLAGMAEKSRSLGKPGALKHILQLINDISGQ
ncbi:undecaprenyldiphospho-muramoylpentapeptide beta-N-acetylglucosaminyltransferase [Phosphitispora fastidiosa]|uniref:undecaprenyldiphospho-muramoylpentapeptide beta-N-acetylglucosaminyltransferase n=1 Tax=Phosphitispora fastidiosa TaxID=2837202 RepID=UPI001E4E28B9|nr:UDP-N-acetylglucosamine--N-acetylmuramyl-(pentapeptide) pyrophosphoryl-undecaprenol N-acetylglucosamine transferase [Phosphitispora fastidiosa]